MEAYSELDAAAIAALVARRDVSVVEVVRAALAQKRATEPTLRAFRKDFTAQALAEAKEIDRAVAEGARLRLAGVPIGVKAWGGLDDFQTVRLRREGCVVIGLTSVPKSTTGWQTWGYTERGPTVNPWCSDRTPGGSSAGSAAAVMAGVVPLATASDGAGSTRIPAAWCGAIGLKPTNGRLPARDSAGLNVPGAIVRSARDAALHMSVLLDEAAIGAAKDKGLAATWSANLGYADVDSEQAEIAWAAVGRLVGAGHVRWHRARADLLDPEPAWIAIRGGGDGLVAAETVRRVNNARLQQLFNDVDVLFTPTTPGPPHGHQGPGSTMSVSLTWAFNISGHPAISIPAGQAADGTPVGLQAVVRHGEEGVLLRLAADLERLNPWPKRAQPTGPDGQPSARLRP
ncbi:amidase [Actinomadura sp. WMMA1423]|uniref:amidase n=1 Tax=Actinomadura sp. WMMA1423 TaxID=2591108 RepID=UPI001146BD2F|nr:amidase [Actinomadura sp. WMMA1423]